MYRIRRASISHAMVFSCMTLSENLRKFDASACENEYGTIFRTPIVHPRVDPPPGSPRNTVPVSKHSPGTRVATMGEGMCCSCGKNGAAPAFAHGHERRSKEYMPWKIVCHDQGNVAHMSLPTSGNILRIVPRIGCASDMLTHRYQCHNTKSR